MTDIYPTHDAYVRQASPDQVDNTNPLQAGGATPSQLIAYLLFPIPARSFSAASLRVRIPTGTGNEATTTFFAEIGNGTFDEATLTWNTRPTGTGQILWSGAPFETANTEYILPLDAAMLSAYAGTDLAIGFHSNGVADIVRFASSEDAVVSYRPMLTVTEIADAAVYDLTITQSPNTTAVADRTYVVDSAGSFGTPVTLVQVAGTPVTITESPAGVFTFHDPGSGGDLGLLLSAGADTASIVVPRVSRPAQITFYGGTVGDMSNWG